MAKNVLLLAGQIQPFQSCTVPLFALRLPRDIKAVRVTLLLQTTLEACSLLPELLANCQTWLGRLHSHQKTAEDPLPGNLAISKAVQVCGVD